MSERLEQFCRDGFLVIENFNSDVECHSLMERAEKLVSDFHLEGNASIFQTSEQERTSDDYFLNSGGNISFFFEKDAFTESGELRRDLFHSLNKIGHAMHDLDPVYDAFSRSPQMKKLAIDLGLTDNVLIQSMHIFKHAEIGGVVDVHQDSTFLFSEPLSCVGFWFALEDATTENGCLWAEPGGHKTSLRKRFKRRKGGGTEFEIFDETPYSTEGMVPLEVKKGTCIVLDGLLPHMSLPNTSAKSRQAYTLHSISNKATYPNDNWLQRTDLRAI
ncbi:MAG TPA: phytanoyl-CoA dioxygenase family protein [Pyrinomonadaceae bacterium]|nr:phytanoyl-CoA dioxygenase family protein [Pyrinomonadaceae bacterium]